MAEDPQKSLFCPANNQTDKQKHAHVTCEQIEPSLGTFPAKDFKAFFSLQVFSPQNLKSCKVSPGCITSRCALLPFLPSNPMYTTGWNSVCTCTVSPPSSHECSHLDRQRLPHRYPHIHLHARGSPVDSIIHTATHIQRYTEAQKLRAPGHPLHMHIHTHTQSHLPLLQGWCLLGN